MCSIAELVQVRGEVQRICVGRKIQHPVFLSSLFSFWQSMHSCSLECTHVCVFISSVSSDTIKLNLFWDCCYFQNLFNCFLSTHTSHALFSRVRPSIRFLNPPPPPLPFNFVHDILFFSKFIIIHFLLFRVRLG